MVLKISTNHDDGTVTIEDAVGEITMRITDSGKLHAELVAENEALRCENARLEKIATQDPLTELLNRHGLYLDFTHFERAAERDNSPADYSIVFIDLKGLKVINDIHGHTAGDTLIRKTANNILKHIRPTDLCARWGGDEFVLFLPCTDEDGARATVAHIITNLPGGIYFRAGIVSSLDLKECHGYAPTLDETIAHADSLANHIRGIETRTVFKAESNVLTLRDTLKN